MCANQRSKKRSKLVGAYVTEELKEKIVSAAEYKGLTVADYIRWIIKENTEGPSYGAKSEKQK
jgi:hypothetical protein